MDGGRVGVNGWANPVFDFGSGPRTVRVERLEVDRQPVVVLFFGLRRQGVVQP